MALAVKIVIFWSVTVCRIIGGSPEDGDHIFLKKILLTTFKTTWFLILGFCFLRLMQNFSFQV
jgi:hypothetical protein